MTQRSWPRRSLEDAARFGRPHCRLYAFIDEEVETPDGPGILFRVFEGEALVDVYRRRPRDEKTGEKKPWLRPYHPSEVGPPGTNVERRESA